MSMTETQESELVESEYVRAQEAFDVHKRDDIDKSPEEQTATELRAGIILSVGVNADPETPFTKTTLNSLYAYLTGEFACHPNHLYREEDGIPTVPTLRRLVYGVVLDPSDRPEKMGDVMDRAFRVDELREVYEAMDSGGDNRGWTHD